MPLRRPCAVLLTAGLAPGLTLSDQQAGAGLLWTAGEVMGVLTMIVIAIQWMNAEERAAARTDRRLDAAV